MATNCEMMIKHTKAIYGGCVKPFHFLTGKNNMFCSEFDLLLSFIIVEKEKKRGLNFRALHFDSKSSHFD